MGGWCRTSDRRWLAALLIPIAAGAAAQTGGTAAPPAPPLAAPSAVAPPPATAVEDSAQPDDILVEGYAKRKDLATFARYPTAISIIRYRRIYDESERMAKCALRSRLSDLSWLRKVVDGEFNSAPQVFAQDRLKRIYITCGEGANGLIAPSIEGNNQLAALTAINGGQDGVTPNIDAMPLGRSIYDRGAYIVQVLKQFAPGLSLTAAQTADPAVQARFNAREVPRNRYRLPADDRYFEVAVCMVRVEPRLATRLATSGGSARFGDVQAALIDRARECVGGARDVQVDPTQFRIYIADAVYRWAVAAKGVDSLIPAA